MICKRQFACFLDRFNSVFMQSRNTNPESNKLLSIFKCVAWLVFELLDLHPFSDGNGQFTFSVRTVKVDVNEKEMYDFAENALKENF